MPGHARTGREPHHHGQWRPDPLDLDDQALVADVRDKGSWVLTGCGHEGVMNICASAQITGRAPAAVIGGFHLSGRHFEPPIGPTRDAFAELAPDFLVPAHCTGWKATDAVASHFPDAFLQTASARFAFEGTDARA